MDVGGFFLSDQVFLLTDCYWMREVHKKMTTPVAMVYTWIVIFVEF